MINPTAPPAYHTGATYRSIVEHVRPAQWDDRSHEYVFDQGFLAHSPDAAVRLKPAFPDPTYGTPRVFVGHIDTDAFYVRDNPTLKLTVPVMMPNVIDEYPNSRYSPAPDTLLHEFGLRARHMNLYADGEDDQLHLELIIDTTTHLPDLLALILDFPDVIAPDQTITATTGRNPGNELLHITVLDHHTHLKFDYELRGTYGERFAYIVDMETLRRPFPLGEFDDAAYAYARQVYLQQTDGHSFDVAHVTAARAALQFKSHVQMTDKVSAWFVIAHDQIADGGGNWAGIVTVEETLM